MSYYKTFYKYGFPETRTIELLRWKNNIQKNNTKIEKWREDALSKALESAEQKQSQVSPDDSRSSIQTTGKSGWCYIGDDQGLRTCSEIGVNDVCMSGDVFPSQSVCINPKLRA